MLNRIGFWLLLPISALQGLWLRTIAVRLPEATGEKSGICGSGAPLQLLAMGDSIIAGVGTGTVLRSMPVQFAEALARHEARCVHWQVAGANGADISDLRKRIKYFSDHTKVDFVLISIGVNDVTGLSSTRHWKNQLAALTKELRKRWPQARVLFMGLPPMAKFPLPPQPLRFTLGLRAATLDAICANLVANRPNMQHVPTAIDPSLHDFCEDGFHPSAKTCSFWAGELAQRIKSDTLS
jgi:lysophospholipase L1-like esterase